MSAVLLIARAKALLCKAWPRARKRGGGHATARKAPGTEGACAKEIRLAAFNAENFYLLLDRDYSTEEYRALPDREYRAMSRSIYNPNKDRGKIEAIAATILSGDYDFVGLCEIGGRETLRNFDRYYLGERYEFHLHETNSRRGIYVGALVKKGRFSRVEAHEAPGDFSRNLLEVRLCDGNFELRVFVVHLKSQHGDDLGIGKRIEEVQTLSRLVARERCVVMGDFNGILIRGEHQFEYEPFLALPFRDVLEALGVPPEERFSHFYFGRGPNFAQLDYIFCSNDLEILSGGTVVDDIPLTRAERARLPSDHLFITATVRPRPTVHE